MKKSITAFLLMGIFSFSAIAQPIFEEDFENGMSSSYIIVDADGNTVTSSLASLFPPAWNNLVFTSDPSNAFAASTSWYNPPGQSDDWLIIPNINLTASNNFLMWDARSADQSALESYEVLISTTGTATSNFTVLTTVNGETVGWNSRSIDLTTAGYSNQTVHIAFRNISNDKYILAVDNIVVREVYNNDMMLEEITMNDMATVNSNVTVSASVVNYGMNTVNSFDLNWSTDGGNTINTHSVTGLNLNSNSQMQINHSTAWTAANAGSITNMEVWISNVNSGPDSDSSNNALTKDIFVNTGATVNKKVLLEEFTTAVCGWCPDGAEVVQNIIDSNANVIPVGIHSGFYTDGMTNSAALAYEVFTTSAPTAMVDRVLYDGETSLAFSRSLWESRANAQSTKGSPVDVNITGSYNSNTRTATVNVGTDFVDYVKPGDLRVVLYVLEDSVTGTGYGLNGYDQVNYLYNDPSSIYYQTGVYNSSAQAYVIQGYIHRHVLRQVYPLGQYWGDPNSLNASSIIPNTQVSNTYTVNVDNAWDEDQVKLVAYVAYHNPNDLSDRYVLNATSVDIQNMGTVGIEEQSAANVGMEVYPNPFKDETNVAFTLKESNEVSIQMYDVAGKLMIDRNLGKLNAGEHLENIQVGGMESGFYFIKLNAGNSTVMKKVSLLK